MAEGQLDIVPSLVLDLAAFARERIGRRGVLQLVYGIDYSTFQADTSQSKAPLEFDAPMFGIANITGPRVAIRSLNASDMVFDVVIEKLCADDTLVLRKPMLVGQLPLPCPLRFQLRVAALDLVLAAIVAGDEVRKVELAYGALQRYANLVSVGAVPCLLYTSPSPRDS